MIDVNSIKDATCCEYCKYYDRTPCEYPCCLCMNINPFESPEDNDISEDQKVKADYGKEKLTLVPRRIIHDICAVRMYGNEKYPDGGPDNWKKVEPERYRDASFRHFLAYLDDPYGVDEESGLPHLWHLACNIAFLCELEDAERELRRNKEDSDERKN